MLELRRKTCFSAEYVAEENGVAVANLSRSHWRDQGEITVQGKNLGVMRRGALGDTFTLESAGQVVAEVKQRSPLGSGLLFEHGGLTYMLRPRAWCSKAFVLESSGRVVGNVRPRGLLSRGVVGDLPDKLPLPVRVFLAWIALVRWDRDDSVAVAAGVMAAS